MKMLYIYIYIYIVGEIRYACVCYQSREQKSSEFGLSRCSSKKNKRESKEEAASSVEQSLSDDAELESYLYSTTDFQKWDLSGFERI